MNAHPMPSFEPSAPDEKEVELARQSIRLLAPVADRDAQLHAGENGDSVEVKLPAKAVTLLAHILTEMAKGNAVTIVPIHAELTTQQSADLLGVSRPFLIKELERRAIPFKKVGTHRRVLYSDILVYKRRIEKDRQDVLDELAELGQEIDPKY